MSGTSTTPNLLRRLLLRWKARRLVSAIRSNDVELVRKEIMNGSPLDGWRAKGGCVIFSTPSLSFIREGAVDLAMDRGCDPEVFQALLSANARIPERYALISAPDLMEMIEYRSQPTSKDFLCFLPGMSKVSSQVKRRISELVANHHAARIMDMQVAAASGTMRIRRL